MKTAIALLALAVVLYVAASEESEDYSNVFDESIDVDSIIDNDRILDTWLKCFFSTGPCSAHAERVKGKITEVLSTVCGKCTPKQKDILKHVLNKFVPKRPNDWKHILEIYDPKGEYYPAIKEFMDSK